MRYRYDIRKSAPAGGFSLIELMVAMVLGLIIIGGAVSVYLASKRSYTEVEQVAALTENGRFALQVLNESLRHISFFGAANPADIRQDGSLGAVTGDCTGNAAAYDTNTTLLAARSDAIGTAFGCITDAVPNTDVLVIKSVLPRPLYDVDPEDPNAVPDGDISFPTSLNTEETYVISNSEGGIILDGADTAPDVRVGNEFALGVAWPYRVQVYYLRNSAVPTFSRKVLEWDSTALSMAIKTQDLVQGVENFRLSFGFDADNDGEVDSYDDLDAIASANGWDRVQALEAYILVRAPAEDPGYVDQKTYRVGDLNITPGGNVRRILMHSNVSLRNPKLTIRGG